MEKEFINYNQALKLKALGCDEPCFKCKVIGQEYFDYTPSDYDDFPEQKEKEVLIPTFSQAINFLYICSNKQIDIELKASDTYEERLRKIDQGCEDLWNLQNSKSN